MKGIKTFKDLKVWQLSHKLSLDVAKLVKTFPRDEKYDLASQMRRSARRRSRYSLESNEVRERKY